MRGHIHNDKQNFRINSTLSHNKIPLLGVAVGIHKCKNNTDIVEYRCKWEFTLREKVQVFIYFAVGACIYAVISSLFTPLANVIALDFCRTADISQIFFPIIKLIFTFYVDKKVCNCLDQLF